MFQAPDYYDFISEPMDFGTITERISSFTYTEPAQLVQDIQLIFQNCFHYNMETADVYVAGKKLHKFFMKKLKEMKLENFLAPVSKSSNTGSPKHASAKKRTSRGK